MKVYPVQGREGLRDPRTKRRIPEEGLEVPETNFWHRRIAHGDVTLDPPVKEEPAAAELEATVAEAGAQEVEASSAEPETPPDDPAPQESQAAS